MKKYLLLFLLFFSIAGAYYNFASDYEIINSANKLAKLNIINNNSENPENYNIKNNISRREMLKIMLNLAKASVDKNCQGNFNDLNSSDWGCGYAETALKLGYISPNKNFRPNDNISKIEAVKMIFKALNIQPIQTVNWKEGYIQVGSNLGVFSKDEYLNFNYDEKSTRGWIFYYAYKSYLNKKVGVKKFEDEYTINYSQPFYEIGNLEYVGKTNDLKFIAREENKNKPFFDNQLVNSFNGPIGNSVTSSINYKGFDLEINGYIEEWYGNLNGVEAKDGKSIAFIIKDYSNFPIIYKKIVRIDKK